MWCLMFCRLAWSYICCQLAKNYLLFSIYLFPCLQLAPSDRSSVVVKALIAAAAHVGNHYWTNSANRDLAQCTISV